MAHQGFVVSAYGEMTAIEDLMKAFHSKNYGQTFLV
jgi:hypothetical protein